MITTIEGRPFPTRFFIYLTVFVVSLVSAGLCFVIWLSSPNPPKSQSNPRAFLFLPPGVSETNAPVPMFVEKHLGGDWILAKGKEKWMTVIYYPAEVEIESIRLVDVNAMGQLSPSSDFVSYEITASAAAISGRSIREVFRMVPLLDRNPLFMSTYFQDIVELKKRVPSRQ